MSFYRNLTGYSTIILMNGTVSNSVVGTGSSIALEPSGTYIVDRH